MNKFDVISYGNSTKFHASRCLVRWRNNKLLFHLNFKYSANLRDYYPQLLWNDEKFSRCFPYTVLFYDSTQATGGNIVTDDCCHDWREIPQCPCKCSVQTMFDVHVTVHRKIGYGSEPTRCDKEGVLFSFLSSTCFGHQYAHHQEYNIVDYSIWCCCPSNNHRTVHTACSPTKTAVQCTKLAAQLHSTSGGNTSAGHHMLFSTILYSWWWSYWCPKHVGLRTLNKNPSVSHLIGSLPYLQTLYWLKLLPTYVRLLRPSCRIVWTFIIFCSYVSWLF
jgi:hypothetical protein